MLFFLGQPRRLLKVSERSEACLALCDCTMQSNAHGDHSSAAVESEKQEKDKYVTPETRPTIVTPQRPQKKPRKRSDLDNASPVPWPLIFVTPQRRPRGGPSTPLCAGFSPPRVSTATRSTHGGDKPAAEVQKPCRATTTSESSDVAS